MKKLLFLFALMLASLSISAQTSLSHTVQRGETIESIAKKYGISVSDLQEANPSTKEYFYIGMKLVIPVKANTENYAQSQDPNSNREDATAASAGGKTASTKTQAQKARKPIFHSDLNGSNFTSVGLNFGSDFSEIVGTTYGIQGQYFLKNRFGATLTIGANFGLEDASTLMIRLGPSYVYPLTNRFYLMLTACYTLTIAEYNNTSGCISGVSAIPTVGMSFNHFKVGLNGDFHWRNGGYFGGGLYLSAAYSFK